jgi:uncharacterized protein
MEVLCRLSYSGRVRDDNNVLQRLMFAVLVLGAVALGTACGPVADFPHTITFHSDGDVRHLNVAIAETPGERAQGLMGVEDLPRNAGMAFLFDAPSTDTFWMRNTPTPLSIAFVGDDRRIVEILDMQPCDNDDCPTYSSHSPFVSAVEAHQGWFEANGIEVGDRVEVHHRID